MSSAKTSPSRKKKGTGRPRSPSSPRRSRAKTKTEMLIEIEHYLKSQKDALVRLAEARFEEFKFRHFNPVDVDSGEHPELERWITRTARELWKRCKECFPSPLLTIPGSVYLLKTGVQWNTWLQTAMEETNKLFNTRSDLDDQFVENVMNAVGNELMTLVRRARGPTAEMKALRNMQRELERWDGTIRTLLQDEMKRRQEDNEQTRTAERERIRKKEKLTKRTKVKFPEDIISDIIDDPTFAVDVIHRLAETLYKLCASCVWQAHTPVSVPILTSKLGLNLDEGWPLTYAFLGEHIHRTWRDRLFFAFFHKMRQQLNRALSRLVAYSLADLPVLGTTATDIKSGGRRHYRVSFHGKNAGSWKSTAPLCCRCVRRQNRDSNKRSSFLLRGGSTAVKPDGQRTIINPLSSKRLRAQWYYSLLDSPPITVRDYWQKPYASGFNAPSQDWPLFTLLQVSKFPQVIDVPPAVVGHHRDLFLIVDGAPDVATLQIPSFLTANGNKLKCNSFLECAAKQYPQYYAYLPSAEGSFFARQQLPTPTFQT